MAESVVFKEGGGPQRRKSSAGNRPLLGLGEKTGGGIVSVPFTKGELTGGAGALGLHGASEPVGRGLGVAR